MTKRERYLAYARFEPVDRVPRRATYTAHLLEKLTPILGANPATFFDIDAGQGDALRPPDGFRLPDYAAYHPGYEHGKNGFSIDGNGCGHLEHGFYHFTEYLSPLRNAERLEDIESYPIASNEGWLDDRLQEARRKAHAEGDYALAWIGHMYESSWQVRGYEAFLVDLVTRREWAELLLDRFCANNVRAAEAAAQAGYDCMTTGDDIANQNDMMFHPTLWREVMKPRWAGVYQAARTIKPDLQIWYHSDGNCTAILDDLVEIGVTILNPVQPECMDPVAIRKRFGKRLAFDGCVGTQTTFPFGTPADMRRTVRQTARALKARQGGLMLSPTHVLEPEVPPDNIVAFFDACDKL